MNSSTSVRERIAVTGTDIAVLARIRELTVHLALWCRPRLTDLEWIDALAWRAIEDLDFIAAVGALEEEIEHGLSEAGYSPGADTVALRNEIALLACHFAGIMRVTAVRIRLEVVETDACHRFHADNVAARLLTTLSGRGTQWIEAERPDSLNQLSVGEVGIFKGRLWAQKPAILHRSPRLAGSGEARLLLAVDSLEREAAERVEQ